MREKMESSGAGRRSAERRDRNGKPVFEQDILRVFRPGGAEVLAVVWSVENLTFMTVSEPDGEYIDFFSELPGPYEVIGNLVETPELLRD